MDTYRIIICVAIYLTQITDQIQKKIIQTNETIKLVLENRSSDQIKYFQTLYSYNEAHWILHSI